MLISIFCTSVFAFQDFDISTVIEFCDLHTYIGPEIDSITPTNGPLTQLTKVFIKGRHHIQHHSQLYDIGIVITDHNIPVDDESTRVGSPHLSCLVSAHVIDENTISCYLSALNGGLRNENGTINRSARYEISGGFVYVQLKSSNGQLGPLRINRKVYYSFDKGMQLKLYILIQI